MTQEIVAAIILALAEVVMEWAESPFSRKPEYVASRVVEIWRLRQLDRWLESLRYKVRRGEISLRQAKQILRRGAA